LARACVSASAPRSPHASPQLSTSLYCKTLAHNGFFAMLSARVDVYVMRLHGLAPIVTHPRQAVRCRAPSQRA
jgi:hypothetical protein